MHDREEITLFLLHIILPFGEEKVHHTSLQTRAKLAVSSFSGCRLYVSTLLAPSIFKAIAFVR